MFCKIQNDYLIFVNIYTDNGVDKHIDKDYRYINKMAYLKSLLIKQGQVWVE